MKQAFMRIFAVNIFAIGILAMVAVACMAQTVKLKIIPEGTRKIILDSTGVDLPLYFDGINFYVTQTTYNTYTARLQRHAIRRNFIIRDTTVNLDQQGNPKFK